MATVEEKALLLVWFAAVLFRCSYWVVAEDPPFTDRYLPRETGLRRFERMLRKWLLRRLIARSKGVFLFIQRSALDEFLPSGVPVFPLKTGVSDEALKTAASVTPPPATVGAADPLRVAYAGAIDDEQGIPELLEAVARVREALPTIRLVLVGVVLPSYARKFSRMLQLHRLESAVTVTGWLSYERMLEELRACDIGCYLRRPSAWAEAAQPLKVCEYMGATIPTVSWDYPGARTLLGGGQFGKLVPPGDVPAVAAAIRGLATNQERGEMVSRIRASVSELAVGASLERLLAECRKNR